MGWWVITLSLLVHTAIQAMYIRMFSRSYNQPHTGAVRYLIPYLINASQWLTGSFVAFNGLAGLSVITDLNWPSVATYCVWIVALYIRTCNIE